MFRKKHQENSLFLIFFCGLARTHLLASLAWAAIVNVLVKLPLMPKIALRQVSIVSRETLKMPPFYCPMFRAKHRKTENIELFN